MEFMGNPNPDIENTMQAQAFNIPGKFIKSLIKNTSGKYFT